MTTTPRPTWSEDSLGEKIAGVIGWAVMLLIAGTIAPRRARHGNPVHQRR